MGTGAGNDHLDEWMRWTHERLRARGLPARYEYDDRALGDVMVIAVDGAVDGAGPGAALTELVVTRRRRGHARIGAVATDRAGLEQVAQAAERLHHAVARTANARRKFVHRVERVVRDAAAHWDAAAAVAAMERPAAAMASLRELVPDATWMLGASTHAEVGDGARRLRVTLAPALAAAVTLGGHRRGLAYDPQQHAFVVRGAGLAHLQQARGGALTTSAAALAGFGLVLAERGLSDADLAALLAADPRALEATAPAERRTSSWCDWIDACDVFDCVDLPSSLVPDCDLSSCGDLSCDF